MTPPVEIDRSEKFNRMNKVRDALATHELSFGELLGMVYGKNPTKAATRTLQYDLEGLRILNLITLENGVYKTLERKQVFKTEGEYKTALKHSQNLLITQKNDYTQKFDLMAPGVATDVLASGEHPLLIEHLRTGYYREIYQPLMRYRELKKTHPNIEQRVRHAPGLPALMESTTAVMNRLDKYQGKAVSNLDPSEDFGCLFDDGKLKDVELVDPEKVPVEFNSGIITNEIEIKNGVATNKDYVVVFKEVKAHPEIAKEFNTLKYEISNQIYTLIAKVENGVPLEGGCEACPGRYVKIG